MSTAPAPGFVNGRIPSLDGIRAVAFLFVFVAHIGYHDVVPGGFMVTVFFFLSGFLITTLMRLEADKKGTVSIRNFYIRRFVRIFPPMYLTIPVALLLHAVGVFDRELTWGGVAAVFAHVTNYYLVHSDVQGYPVGLGIYWSLSVEEHYYLIFPFMYVLMRRYTPSVPAQVLVLGGLCLLVLLWRLHLMYNLGLPEDYTYPLTHTRFDSIMYGCILAVWGNPLLEHTRFRPAFWWSLFVAGLMVLVFTFVYRNDPFRGSWRYTLQGLALIPMFVCSLRYSGTVIYRVLNMPWLMFIGHLSYSLYLIHYIVIMAFEPLQWVDPQLFEPVRVIGSYTFGPDDLNIWLKVPVEFAITYAYAYLMYKYVETPLFAIRKRLQA